MLDRAFSNSFLRSLRHLQRGSLTIHTPDDKTHEFVGTQDGVHGHIRLHDWGVVRAIALRGDIGLAETYREGRWHSDDPTALFTVGLHNQAAMEHWINGSRLGRWASRLSYQLTQNTLRGSKRNILAHYDLGNAFYSLWLDPTMTYSSALFHNPEQDLVSAQLNKYDRIVDRIGNSGRVLEIGCGWGGFADRAMTRGDYALEGLTISDAQHAYATQRLGNRAAIELCDYRLKQGRYDRIVSIEMFEAVGEKYWSTYFNKVKALLGRGGKAMIQSITIDDRYFESYRAGGDAIRTFIFPGGMLPSPERFAQQAQLAGLQVTDQFAFGQDYALTLRHWLERFEAQLPAVRSLGFDEPFIRLWRFYLTSCIAVFTVGRTDVMQFELQHAH